MDHHEHFPPGAAARLPGMRITYERQNLTEEQAGPDPFALFEDWFARAAAAGIPEANAMTLATVSAAGRPSARVVLLKGLEAGEFVFYTSYNSRKGRDLAENPYAALVFYWAELERQVRAEGRVRRVSPEQSDAYFASRPKGSRLSAWASAQSQPLRSREEIEDRLRRLEREYADHDSVPRPPHWGGYALLPDTIEFWQGRPDRLHDRLAYQRAPEGGWQRTRLSP